MSLLQSNSGADSLSLENTSLWQAWKLPLIASGLGFAILLPLIFLSIDVTDPGFHYTNQLFANRLGVGFYKINKILFLTDIIGGIWMTMTSSLGLIGVKLGGSVVYAVCAGMITKVFQDYVEDKVFLVIGIITALLIATLSLFIMSLTLHLNYYTVPMLLGVIYVTLSLSFINNPTMGKSIILGALLPVLFFSRYSLVLFWITPLLSIWFLEKGKRKWVLATYTTAIVVFWAFLILLKTNLSEAFLSINSLFEDDLNHSYGGLFLIYFKQLGLALKLIGYLFLLVVPFLLIKQKVIRRKIIEYLLLAAFALLLFAPFLPSRLSFTPWKVPKSAWLHKHILSLQDYSIEGAVFFMLLILAVGYAAYYFYNQYRKKSLSSKKNKELLFIFLSGLVFIANFLGSPTGITKASFGCWFLIGVCVVIASYKKMQRAFLSKLLLIISLACMCFLYTHFHTDYLWSIARLGICKEGALKGTITTKKRQKLYDELLAKVASEFGKGSYAFAYHYIPGIYYLTNTYPITSFCEPVVLKEESLKKLLDQDFSAKRPELIIRAKFNSWNYRWCKENHAFVSNPYYISRFLKKVDIIEERLEEYYKPKKIWSNEAFEILVPNVEPSNNVS